MKLSYFIAFIFFCFCNTLTSQSITRVDLNNIRSDEFYRIAGHNDDRIYIYRNSDKKRSVVAFNDKLKKLWSREISYSERTTRNIGFLTTDSFFHIISLDRKDDTTALILHGYDHRGEQVSPVVLRKGSELPLSIPVLFSSSQNNKYGAVFYELKDKMYAWIIDSESKGLADSLIIELNENKRTDFRGFLISNEGAPFYIQEQNNYRNRRKDHNLQIFYQKQGESLNHLKIDLPDFLIRHMRSVRDNINKRWIISGLYSEDGRERSHGTFRIVLEDDGEVNNITTHPFGEELKREIIGGDIDKEGGIRDMRVLDIKMRRDGGILLVTELQKELERVPGYTARSFYRNYGSGYWTDYYYEDLILTSYAPDGTLEWSHSLHKKQYSQDDEAHFSSVFIFESPEWLRLVFNDEITRNSNVSEYLVNPLGESYRQSVFTTEFQDLQIFFSSGEQISADSFVTLSKDKNNVSLVLIDYSQK